jgi:hypothetical protein
MGFLPSPALLRERVRAVSVGLVLLCIAGSLLLVGTVFAMVGIFESLTLHLTGWLSGLIVGGGAFLSGLLLLAAVRPLLRGSTPEAGARRRRLDSGRAPQDASGFSLQQMADLGEAIARASEGHRPQGIDLTLAGFVAGLVASQSLRGAGGASRSPGSGSSARGSRE